MQRVFQDAQCLRGFRVPFAATGCNSLNKKNRTPGAMIAMEHRSELEVVHCVRQAAGMKGQD